MKSNGVSPMPRIDKMKSSAGFNSQAPTWRSERSLHRAATDRKHHFDFLKNAENYRRQYVKELNTSEMERKKLGSTPEARREFWAQVSEFQPRFVSSAADFRRCMAAMCCVIIWGIVAIVAALNACPNVGGYGKD